MFSGLFEDDELTTILRSHENLIDPWVNTPFEGYVRLSIHSKGKFGEEFIKKYMASRGAKVKKRTGVGHDTIIDDYKVESKFSLANSNPTTQRLISDSFFLNHISKEKDWDRLIFVGINPTIEESRIFWMTKQDFIESFNDPNPIFTSQQGGQKIQNDDYKLSGNFTTLLNSKYVRSMDQWEGLTESVPLPRMSTLESFFT